MLAFYSCFSTVSSNITVESCACAKDSAHRRKYEAVLDTLPSTNSIVSMN